jgi:hypothetical protein
MSKAAKHQMLNYCFTRIIRWDCSTPGTSRGYTQTNADRTKMKNEVYQNEVYQIAFSDLRSSALIRGQFLYSLALKNTSDSF